MRRPGSPGSLLSTLLSIIFAVVLWVVAINRRTFDVSVTVPVVLPQVPDSLVILEPVASESVTITFTGRGAAILLDQLRGSPLLVAIGPASRIPGGPWPASVQNDLSPSLISWSGVPFTSLIVESFSPESVVLEMDRSQTDSTIPVKVMASGPVPARFFWSRSDMGTVEVTGAASVMRTLDSIRTQPVLPGQPVQTVGFETPSSIRGCSPPSTGAWLVRPVRIVSFDDL